MISGGTMRRTLKNVTAVLLITLFTAFAIFATVQLTGRIVGPTATAGAQSAPAQTTPSGSHQLVCPATGCAADSCHATQ
jgi:hypothetical protein